MTVTDILSPIAMACLLIVSGTATWHRWRALIRMMRTAKGKADRFRDIRARISGFFEYVIGQARLLRWPYAGIAHAFIFWGFLVLLTAILQGIVEAFVVPFQFNHVPGAPVIAVLQDVFCTLVLIGVVFAAFNRLVLRPIRFRGSHNAEALLILGWIALLLVAMECNYATKIAEGDPSALGQYRPFARLLSHLFTPLGPSSSALIVLHGIFFWSHLILVLSFLVYLGYSKHLHVITAAPNVFFRSLAPKGRLPLLDIDALMESAETEDVHFGVADVHEFSWKDMLDLYTCTECGRCQTHCPAYNTGKPLSPKTLITDLRDAVYEAAEGSPVSSLHHGAHLANDPDDSLYRDSAPMWLTNRHEDDLPGAFQPSWIAPETLTLEGETRALHGQTILDETLWACTTCGACMDQCPVFIEHVPKIIQMRRNLVLDESRIPKQAETALRNIENLDNPYGLPQQARSELSATFGVPTIKDKPDAEYLLWIGCAATYDDRAKQVMEALIGILKRASVSFAILGPEEHCTGDPARRLGNEYLFQEKAKQNVETLNRYQVKRVITSCPHCFNTIANEYPELGGTFTVIHHSQLINDLLTSGAITPKHAINETVTYHDSCYLGRWNNVFTPPREILERIPGLRLVEMARSKSEGMCCGAGGGRMWMEETSPRINHERVEQARSTSASRVATACPFCLGMFDEGIAAKELAGSLEVDDIAVYVARSLMEADVAPHAANMAMDTNETGSAD